MSQHALFILASYALAGAVIGGLTLALILEHRNLRRALAKLPQRATSRGDSDDGGRA